MASTISASETVGGPNSSYERAASLAPRGLTFLRVFSLGTLSNALLESIGKHWRSIGSIQLITGPDVAHT